MKQAIDLDTWERGSVFRHFIRYSDPYFGVCTDVDCTAAYHYAKERDLSFFLYYFYLSLHAANAIPAFRIRLDKGRPVIYDVIHGSPTILRDDGGMGFALLPYADGFKAFCQTAEPAIARIRSSRELDVSQDHPDTIYYSILPWIRFTSVTHPLDLPNTEGVPILTFGKMYREGKRRKMPLGIHAHHALMDGQHMADFIRSFQDELDNNM
ncbi:MAG: chloramphenicol acetyltransferase [FCB group bacterium]|nr:chloramphenicol acetyltransferase [FCB group bacterium]